MSYGSRRPTRVPFLNTRQSGCTSFLSKRAQKPRLNPFQYLRDVLEQSVKGFAPTNLTELWTDLSNFWKVIPMEHVQKLVKFFSRHVADVIKVREGSTPYQVGINNSVALQYI
ncbi:hypothetical protein TNCV_2868421 [Trichonephila clavipes]|nr:hypothetical protein TNCV_2868421 [Trichonephila clavipes]